MFAINTTIYDYILQHDVRKLHLKMKTFVPKGALLLVRAPFVMPKHL